MSTRRLQIDAAERRKTSDRPSGVQRSRAGVREGIASRLAEVRTQIPYIVAGCGGHSPLSSMRATLRTPYQIDDTLTLESYDDTDYGYLRIVVSATTLTIEFHPESDGGTTKTPDDTVTVNLSTRTISS